MEFNNPKRRKRGLGKEEYSSRLQIYKIPPVQTISLDEFEELALQRLKLLQEIERVKQRSLQEGVHKGSDDYQKRIMASCKLMPLSYVGSNGYETKHREERRRDHISHYILRLAYCRNEEMRRWFLNQETELLRYRFLDLTAQERTEFFLLYKDDFNFDSEIIPRQTHGTEKFLGQLSEDIYRFYQHKSSDGTDSSGNVNFHKVPFTAALDLVQSRQAVVKEGFVYIPESKTEMVVSLVYNKFRARLSEELVKTLHHLSVVDDDERISPLLKKLKYRYLGEDFSSGSQLQGKIQLSQINLLARESFPPCMRHLHETLRREHHLKHFARLQYGLFLKSIGLTLEQALALWRAEFIKKMDPDKFDKQYAYNVRHSYGKEGKRANYTAYSCMKIIMGNSPGQGDCHGCPFKHWDDHHIQQMLVAHGLSHQGVRQVMSYLQEHHYQLACQKYFEVTHGLSSAPFSLEHPNQFYLESRKIRSGTIKQEQSSDHEPVKLEVDDMKGEFGDLSEGDLIGLDDDMDTL